MEKRTIRKKNYGSASRMSYSGIDQKLEMPNLIEMQRESYKWFLDEGLKEVFQDVSPITDHSGNLALEFIDFRLDSEPKFSVEECKERDTTYAASMRVKTRLHNKESGEIEEREIFMGDFPLMTETGTFIVNGAERVIISQLVRSPGIYYSMTYDKVGKQLITTTVIPNRGAWIEYETDSNDVFSVRVDRTRKVPVSMLMRSLGLGSNHEIIEVFGEDPKILATLEKDNTTTYEEGLVELYKKVRPGEPPTVDSAKQLIESMFFDAKRYDLARVGRYKFNKKLHFKNRIVGFKLAYDVVDDLGEVLATANTMINEELAIELQNSGVKYVELIKEEGTFRVLSNRMVDANVYLQNYDINARELGIKKDVYYPELTRLIEEFEDKEELEKAIKDNMHLLIPKHIMLEDIFASMNYVMNIDYESGAIDDIDHLGNRRIRAVGELLQNQYRIGFARLERVIRERMTTMNQQETISASTLINIRPVTAVIKEFFGSSQLSQFMDQTNPLSEIATKRRLSALGPGGLSRDRAGFEVRDVHSSHFGRMCPIESPEGPNIGLINSLACYARINEYGFIEAPYIVVEHNENESIVTDKVVYLTADEEEKYIIGQANEKLDERGHFINNKIVGRHKDEFVEVDKNKIDLVDVSPKQMISIVTALIPFLENNESTRALMGSNMQRQAVPLLKTESPIVGTGMENKIAVDSGVTVIAKADGEVFKVSANEIVVLEESGRRNIYKLTKFTRSNNGTCVNQRPIVSKGDLVKKGQVLADGPSTSNGELALGKNPLIGFMTWEGYNYEDAILLSEKLVQDDVYTSVHIEEYEIESRETKLGAEEITRDIPNIGEDALKNLDAKGIIRIGAEVKPGDILVGKVAPKGETELTAEERLLRAIFGEKAREVRDTSLRLPHGESGIIVDVKIFNRDNSDELSPGVNELVRCYIAQKRKISVGDKMAGRHGNKGVISRILPVEDMPFLPNGRPLDIVLNPLGVPSRMNIGQVLEVHLGLAAKALGWKVETPVFDGAHEVDIMDTLTLANDFVNKDWDEFKNIWEDVLEPEVFADLEANKDRRDEWKGVPLSTDGKIQLRDGRSGEEFDNRVTVGYMHYLKLHHLVDDKIHARSTGPYSLVTQQPLGGKAQFGGQRFGEMEVWALEAYGASYTLQEILTVKSDDIVGRVKTYEAIVKGENIPEPGIPESFKVLLKELQALALDVKVLNKDNEEIEIRESGSDAEDINAVYKEEMENTGKNDGFIKHEETVNAERTMIIEDVTDESELDDLLEIDEDDEEFDSVTNILDYDDEM